MTLRMRYMWAREFRLRLSKERYRVFVRENGGAAKALEMGKGEWNDEYCADPFLFRRDNANWLFYETLDPHGKGVLGCFRQTENGEWTNQGIVLEEEYHLSYPQVFEEDGHIYMIPESCDLETGGKRASVSLYEAEAFPFGWKKRTVLIPEALADSTLLKQDGHYYLSALRMFPKLGAELWHAPALTGPWTLHPESAHTNQSRRLRRNGGAFERFGGQLCRIAQDCNGDYGKRLFRVPVLELDPARYEEGAASLLLLDQWGITGKVHTYNRLDAPGRTIEVVDLNDRVKFPLLWRMAAILRICLHAMFSLSIKKKRGFRIQLFGFQVISGTVKRRPALFEVRIGR